MEIKYYSITNLNKAIKNMFDNKPELQNIHIKGEISNFKNHSRGHLYFTLKDETSEIKAIMFESSAIKLNFKPKDGDKVLVTGRVSVYEGRGEYQIYVSSMQLDGIGNLYLEFEKLKKKLFEEGLFDPKYKKPIPKYPKRIGIITASTGAAIKDIISTINRRYPIVETILFPCLVQGDSAKFDIVEKIKIADTYNLDVIILGRGGGSIEDLWPFNEEIVAREIFNTNTPIISGVGHEPDFTISDFVSDLRAPTPTGAAEMCVPNKIDLFNQINNFKIRSCSNIQNKIDNYNLLLNKLKNRNILKNPMILYENKELYLDGLLNKLNINMNSIININKDKLNSIKQSYIFSKPDMLFKELIYNYNDLIKNLKLNMNNYLENKTNNYTKLIDKVNILNPLNTIKRGYTITKINNKTIKSIKDVKTNDLINIEVSDGTINARVED